MHGAAATALPHDRRRQWLAFGLCFAVVLLDGVDTAAIGYLAPALMAEWGIQKTALGPVLSAALAGLTCGSLAAGPLADRYGRRRPIVLAVLLFGLASIGASRAAGLGELTAWRFVTGIGLGAAMPNAVTLVSEHCAPARRAMLTNAMFCGFPLGAALGGLLAAWMVPRWGWHSVLLAGGVAPLLLALALLWRLPESAGFGSRQAPEGAGLALVLSPRYRWGTVMLWLSYFMGLAVFYSLVNWMPVLFREAGLAPRDATLVAALFPLGGIGAVLFGWLMDRHDGDRVIACGFALTALAVWAIGRAVDHLGLLVAAVLAAGTLLNTAQSSLPALAAAYYPAAGRATGVAWMLGVGRIGGIAGSFLVAQLAALQFGFAAILDILALPCLAAAACLLAKRALRA